MTTFEHTGFWWDATESGTRWPGTLRFDPVSGAVLTRVIPTRQALKKRMEFGNEVSFGRRLRTLVKDHEAALAAAVPDPCSWVQTIIDYRNGFTHHPVTDEAVPDRDKVELIQCNYVLQILLELCFLKSMTLEEETIAALAKSAIAIERSGNGFFVTMRRKSRGRRRKVLRAATERRRANARLLQ